MKKCSLFLLGILSLVMAFSQAKPGFIGKIDIQSLSSRLSSCILSAFHENSNMEIELSQIQLTDAIKSNDRTYSFIGVLAPGLLTLNDNIDFISIINRSSIHFSHKEYLFHIYPSHNFW